MRRPYLHLVALALGIAGVVLGRVANGAFDGDGLPHLAEAPAISLPGIAPGAQIREVAPAPSVTLEEQDAVLVAPALPETVEGETELQEIATSTPEAATDVRARVDVLPDVEAAEAPQEETVVPEEQPVEEPTPEPEQPIEEEPPAPAEEDPIRVDATTPEQEAQNTGAAGQQGAYFNYIVLPGDTVNSIAAQFGLLSNTILAANLDLVGAETLQPGQNIRIPLADGVLHPVQPGDTIAGLAEQYGTTVEAIVGFAPNGLTSPDDIRIGQELLVVGGTRSFAPPEPAAEETPAETAPEPVDEGNPFAADPAAPSEGAPAAEGEAEVPIVGPEAEPPNPFAAEPPPPEPSPTEAPAVEAGGQPSFVWPFSGNISSYFGPGHPLGIDIDGFQNPTGPVAAAAAGTVTFAGGDPGYSYGYYVIISHGGGWETLYAHLSSISVSVGQVVSAGEAIGIVGTTGYSTGVHLHFEVRQGGAHLNPLVFLP
ncbi:MAG TPA: LysM peptidoglycan-binding domain-containing M23 family metallopeptidase [Dehalococcoidia bacterium]|nr:LysM peptidoglycan-binding domain-containing M23 family metallopeptidase [Dehalococcoidia bacterium]